eukprot:CAMPEP_0115063436 /NCGR_PEP_ID=MMETSP0227-20121206/9108_1 /TAXON_ID=89957 /ORGANISM="Polarella glacialis, Strain CCMP 1383" /LENGTH=45 /DNA_ID= /DNA_START= /DNA_END= /DNA_ORIENTATION=
MENTSGQNGVVGGGQAVDPLDQLALANVVHIQEHRVPTALLLLWS